MFRIGIIGSENSHAMAFSKLYNGLTPGVSFPDLRVVAVTGEDDAATQAIVDACGIDFVPDKPADLLGRVDAVMVTSRNGALHPGYVRPFLEAGLPVFIDKPIANDGMEALSLARLAKAKGLPIMGGSSTKLVADTLALRAQNEAALQAGKALGGSVWAPVSQDNPYGGFYFYASHLIEICMTIFGMRPQVAQAFENHQNVTALLQYDAYTVSCHYLESVYHYGATVLTRDAAFTHPIDISDCYRAEAEEFAQMLRTGIAPHPLHSLIAPVFALNAVEAAFRTGVAQRIYQPNL